MGNLLSRVIPIFLRELENLNLNPLAALVNIFAFAIICIFLNNYVEGFQPIRHFQHLPTYFDQTIKPNHLCPSYFISSSPTPVYNKNED